MPTDAHPGVAAFSCPNCRYEVAGSAIVRCPECSLTQREGALAFAKRDVVVRLAIAFAFSAYLIVGSLILLRVAEPEEQGLDLATPLLFVGVVLLGMGAVLAAMTKHWSTAVVSVIAGLAILHVLYPVLSDPTNARVQLCLLAMLLASSFTLEVAIRVMLKNESARRALRLPKALLHLLRTLAIVLIAVVLYFAVLGRNYFGHPRYMLVCILALAAFALQALFGTVAALSIKRLADQ